MSHQPTQPSLKSLIGFSVVVLVAAYLIWSSFGGLYGKAVKQARFDFHKPAPPGTAKVVDLHPLLKSTPELVATGKQVFEANCVPCHGPEGYGNGPRAAGLNPPPMNYHTGKFLHGTSVLAMYHTVTDGSPGTAMPSFIALTPEERMAAVHYIQDTFMPKGSIEPNTAAELASIAAPAASGPAQLPPLQPVPQGPRIPIDVAMQVVAQQAKEKAANQAGPHDAPPPADASLSTGQALYEQRCQSCHGDQAQGGIPIQMIGSAPYVEVTAADLRHPHMLSSINDAAGFQKVVLHGLPGRMMPGQGTLTRAQLDSLYAYVQQLVLKGVTQ